MDGNKNNGVMIHTQTSMCCLRDCPRKYRLTYIDSMVQRTRSDALSFGSAFHDVLAARAENRSWPNLEQLIDEKFQLQFAATMEAYERYMPPLPQYQPEIEFEYPLRNPDTGRFSRAAVVRGIVDGILDDGPGGRWLIEHKTTGAPIDQWRLSALDMDLQLHVYRYFAERSDNHPNIDGVLYNIVRKPGCRYTDNDTPESYIRKAREWYARNHATCFYREKFRAPRMDIEKWLWDYHREILWRRRTDTWPPNPGSCTGRYGKCRFYNYCASGENPAILDMDFIKGDPHGEFKKEVKE